MIFILIKKQYRENNPLKFTFEDGSYIEHKYRSDGTLYERIERERVISTVNGTGSTTATYKTSGFTQVGDFILEGTIPTRMYIDGGYVTLNPYNSTNTATSYNYYVHDNQGSVRAVLNEQGELTQATDYSAYGVPSTRYAGTAANNHLHLGLEWQPMKGVSGYYNNARFRDALLAGMFYQQDPLTEKYYPFSPYHYGMNNPNRYFDINGMDIWNVDTSGYARKILDDKEIDEIQMVDSNGEKMLDANGTPLAITFEYGTIESHTVQKWGNNEQSDYWKVRGDDNAQALFEFFSENISANNAIEFSLTQTGMAGENGLNFVSTSHERGAERSFFQLYMDKLQFGYTYRSHTHSHPASPEPSSEDKRINSVISKTQIGKGMFKPSFSIYYVNKNDKNGKYNYYVPY